MGEEEEEEEEEAVVLTGYRSRKKQKKQKKKQKALNAFGKARQPPPEPLEADDATPNPEPAVVEPSPELEQEQDEISKPAKKKGRRAKNRQKGQQPIPVSEKPATPSVDTRHVCVTCKSTFPSRNKLFAHVKKTGHAKPL